MKIIKVISEWKKRPSMERMKNRDKGHLFTAIPYGMKMVQAIVEEDGYLFTAHIAVTK